MNLGHTVVCIAIKFTNLSDLKNGVCSDNIPLKPPKEKQ